MANEKPLFTHSFVAASDMSSSSAQYRFVTLAANGRAHLCAATTNVVLGVLQNQPALGEVAEVMLIGVSKVRVGAADIASGALVGTGADGRALTLAVGTTGTAQYVAGRVIDAVASEDNDGALVSVLVNTMAPTRAV
jgi:hypothetical protein